MTLFDLKLIKDELILFLDHKEVLIIIQTILQNLKQHLKFHLIEYHIVNTLDIIIQWVIKQEL